jgi:hypothetical protein
MADTEESLSYYPNEEYLRRNWAPEKAPVASLRALANAQRQAAQAKIFSPFLADKFLPNALVEGRLAERPGDHYGPGTRADFGFNSLLVPRNPDIDRQMAQMGVGDGIYYENRPEFPSGYQQKPTTSTEDRAKMAAITLGQKAKLYGDDLAIERWNGIGPGAKAHVQKVNEMMRMLRHPKNQALFDAYQRMLSE